MNQFTRPHQSNDSSAEYAIERLTARDARDLLDYKFRSPAYFVQDLAARIYSADAFANNCKDEDAPKWATIVLTHHPSNTRFFAVLENGETMIGDPTLPLENRRPFDSNSANWSGYEIPPARSKKDVL